MREHHLDVPRTARYHTLGDAGARTEQVWFVCHGYRQLAARFLTRFRGLDDGTRLIVAPEGLSRFYVDLSPARHGPEHRVGAAWMTREDRLAEIADYVRYLDRLAGVVLPRVDVLRSEGGQAPSSRIVLGFSQGVHTVSRWAAAGAVKADRLILWGAYLPHDLDMEKAAPVLRKSRLTLVHGDTDPAVDEDRHRFQEERLEEWRIPYESITHPGGHDVDRAVLAELARTGPSTG